MKRCNPKTSPVLTLLILVGAMLVGGCASPDATISNASGTPRVEGVKYVILLIGDGMGPVQLAAARRYVSETENGVAGLTIDSLPYRTRTATDNVDGKTTDSAASGTAISCGVKTKNGMLGQTPDGTPVTSVAAMAKQAGRRVGLLTTKHANDATPSSFYAHIDARGKYNEIAEQFTDSGFDLLAGDFINYKGDKQVLYDKYSEAGYANVSGRNELAALLPGEKAVVTFSDSDSKMPMQIEVADGDMTLAELTDNALRLLDGPQGFFLMVEGGRIDSAGHANDAGGNVMETLAFDRAVARAVAFYREHPDETLVVATADHETGGMALAEKSADLLPVSSLAAQKANYYSLKWRLDNLSDAEKMDWSVVGPILVDEVGLGKLTRPEEVELQKAWMDSTLPAADRKELGWGNYHPAVDTALKIKARRCGITWGTHGHTSTKVVTAAIGVGAEQFAQADDNTKIAAFLMACYNRMPDMVVAATPEAEQADKTEEVMAY